MATFTEARYGLVFNFAPGDNGWGSTFNRAVKTLGATLNCYLISDTLTTPPSSPADGDAYYVPTGATGAWAGRNGSIAAYQGGAWNFSNSPKGLRAYILSRTSFYWYNGTAWISEASSAGAGVTSVNGETGDVVLTASDVGAATTANITTALSNFANNAFGGGAEGDIVVYGASGWQRIAHGTDGQVLYTHGAGALPAWGDPPTGTGGGVGGGGGSVTPGSTIAPAAVNAPDDFTSGTGATGSNLNVQAGGGTHQGGTVTIKGGTSSGQIPGDVRILSGRDASATDGSPTGSTGIIEIRTPDSNGAGQATGAITIRTGRANWNGTPGPLTLQSGDQYEDSLGFDKQGGSIIIKAGRGGYAQGAGGDIYLTPGRKHPAGSARNGLILVDTLPTSYPGNPKAIWLDGGLLRVGPVFGTGAKRFWRVNTTSNVFGGYTSMAEIAMKSTAGGSNLLISSGAATSNTSISGYDATKAIDGNASTWWTADAPFPAIWTYDFGAGVTQNIVELVITARNDGASGANCSPGTFSVEASDDGTTWATRALYDGVTWTSGQTQTFSVP